MPDKEDEAEALLRLIKRLPEEDQGLLMAWLLKPTAERARAAEQLGLHPPVRPAPVRAELTMLPVRLPKDRYDALKRWAFEHQFPMAVVVRGLVERFLDQQAAS